MIELHYWPTPNGWKVSVMLEECGLPYRVEPVDIGRGAQFASAFLAISPNNRMPAIVDRDPEGGGAPVAVFESGAILVYLAEKTGRFLSKDLRERTATLQWLMWQMGGLGPMAGQNGHFRLYAPEKLPYAIARYGDEVDRLWGVLDRQLARTGAHVAGADYTIADMAIFPWVRIHRAQQVAIDEFPHVAAWMRRIAERPAVRRGIDLGREWRAAGLDEEARRRLFGQTARSVAASADEAARVDGTAGTSA